MSQILPVHTSILAPVPARPVAGAGESGPVDGLAPSAPAPAPKRPRKVEGPRYPEGHAVLHRPRAEGGYERLLKVAVARPRTTLEVQDGFVFFTEADDHMVLNRCDEAGRVRFHVDLPEGFDPRDLVLDEAGDRLLVLSESALLAFGASDGRPVGEVPLPGQSVPRLAVTGEGAVVVTRGKQVAVLDRELRTVREETLDFMPGDPKPLKGGAVALVGGGMSTAVRVIGADGSEILTGNAVRSWTDRVAEDGTLWFVEDASLPGFWGPLGAGARAVHFDPESGSLDRFTVGSDTKKLHPLADGAFLAVEDDRVLRYDARGMSKESMSLRHGEYADGVYVAPGEGAVWVASREPQNGETTLRRLYRMPLGESSSRPTFWGSAAGEVVWEGSGIFQPVVLSDDSVLLVREGGVDHLGADGQLRATYEDSAAAFAALGNQAVGRRVDGTSQRLDLRDALEGAARQWNFAGDLPEEPAAAGGLGDDGTLGFAMEPVASLPAPGAGSGLLDFTLTDRLEVPFARADRAPVEAAMDTLQVSSHRLRAESGDRFTTVLPVTKGKRSFVAAGTARGEVSWWEPGVGEPTRYSADAGIRSLELGAGPVLTARAADGSVLVLDLPRGLARGLEVPGPAGHDGPQVVEGPAEVIIGDVRLPRQGA